MSSQQGNILNVCCEEKKKNHINSQKIGVVSIHEANRSKVSVNKDLVTKPLPLVSNQNITFVTKIYRH